MSDPKKLLRIVIMAEHEHDAESPAMKAVDEGVFSLVDLMAENGIPGVLATMDYDHKERGDE